ISESSIACLAAATENCPNLSSRRARLLSMKSFGSKSGTSAALWLRKIDGSNRVSERTADRSRRTPSHIPSFVDPIGVIAPIPVITTLRLLIIRPPPHVPIPQECATRCRARILVQLPSSPQCVRPAATAGHPTRAGRERASPPVWTRSSTRRPFPSLYLPRDETEQPARCRLPACRTATT